MNSHARAKAKPRLAVQVGILAITLPHFYRCCRETPSSPGFVVPDLFSLVVFCGILCAVLVAQGWAEFTVAGRLQETPRFSRAFSIVLFSLGVLMLLTLFVESGLIEARPVPWALLFLGLSNLYAIGLAVSNVGYRWAMYLTTPVLIAFHTFRLPLEWVLHRWASQGTVPETMTWTGSNFDVLTGVLAPLCALAARGKYERPVAWAFSVVGFVLLLNVMRVALLSSPVPFGWGTQPPLQLAFHLPYAWIVPVCVGGALAGHLVLFRRLLGR